MKLFNSALLIIIGTLGPLACSSMKHKERPMETMADSKQIIKDDITHESLGRLIQEWPQASKAAANSMTLKYGLPKEATPSLLRWEENAPFQRIVVHKEEVTHNFPAPHADVLEQAIDYKVPADKVSLLYQFNGSLQFDKTRGELSVRCDKEEINTLALNLAHEIIKDRLSVKEARKKFGLSAHAFMSGNSDRFTKGLTFRPDSETANADMAILPRIENGVQAEEARGTLESDNMEE